MVSDIWTHVGTGRTRYFLFLVCVVLWQVYFVTMRTASLRKAPSTSANATEFNELIRNIISASDTKDVISKNNLLSKELHIQPRPLVSSGTVCAENSSWTDSRGVFHLKDDTSTYFNNEMCFIQGTAEIHNHSCICRPKWHGRHCSIPRSVWKSGLSQEILGKLTLRTGAPRRIIQAFPFNMEFDLLDVRFHEISDVVDVFLILESNYTAYGRPKPLYLMEKLKQNNYTSVSCKIVHVWLDYFPPGAKSNGWITDELHRNYISQHGLPEQVRGQKEDDLFVLTDADELPSREALLFLKLHDGYPEPVSLQYHQRIYTFFWRDRRRETITLPAVVSLGVLRHILGNKCKPIRSGISAIMRNHQALNVYMKLHNRTVFRSWTVGSGSEGVGWHCSWCFKPQGIQNKLISAQNGDFPRWGDYPEKTKISYIKKLIAKGMWFDDKGQFMYIPFVNTTDYAPQFTLDNPHVYNYLLKNQSDIVL